ncbi:Spo0B domain-containing protein [Paenibacillus thermotolerans]|uniref:Spo0B domain-containing protein n=1 Tax=Paenibacillus thermotolerans TaxID=3027807 RepID=UPI0023680DC2|nr:MULTISPECIES: Spo0B domain-containing protein [unclassified Paenibacillus]
MTRKKVSLHQAALDEHRMLWIETMNHLRHDWLNDLQLLMGYVQMKKVDKLSGYVDMLKQRLAEESRASRLGHLGLIELLYTYRSRPHPYRFELMVDEAMDIRACIPSGDAVESAVRSSLTAFEQSAQMSETGEENILRCRFVRTSDGCAVDFAFQGSYGKPELKRAVERLCSVPELSTVKAGISAEFEERTARLWLRFPFASAETRLKDRE